MSRLLFIFIFAFIAGCGAEQPKADAALLTSAALIHRNTDQLTQVIIHDMFPPPVASRIYAYTSLAGYEAARYSEPGLPSIAAQLKDFAAMPVPEAGKKYNYLLASTKAFFTVAQKITFSADTLGNYQDKIYADFAALLDKETFDRSVAFGAAIGAKVLERTAADNYKQTRGMPRFIGSNEKGKWRPTPPDYLDGAEPYWGKIKPFTIESSAQFVCPAPPRFTDDTTGAFYELAKEVYTIGTTLTPEQKEIARYWDDNPFVMEHSGHLMYGNKKITPVGHWIGIAGIASAKKGLGPGATAQTYLLTATAIYDSFISCWDDKFITQVVRPVTLINEWFDPNWQPLLQTPPFPEHPSGHSAISAASATVLTEVIGDNFSFVDTSDLKYIGMKRAFASFHQAAAEASISRVYGGIHYRSGVDAGAIQGQQIAQHVMKKIKRRE
ncbi:MAG TPA: vanadium-dependent haloperoxidase [Flavisolibacter sp.]